jgi:hypothetical protein
MLHIAINAVAGAAAAIDLGAGEHDSEWIRDTVGLNSSAMHCIHVRAEQGQQDC